MKNDLAIFEGYGIRRLTAGAQKQEKRQTCAVSCHSTGASSALKTPFQEVSYGR